MMKRIIAFVTVFWLLPIAFSPAYAAGIEGNDTLSEAYDVLSALGYVNADFEKEMIPDIGEVTRAEFAEMAYRVFGFGMKSGEVYYHDVPATHFAAAEIAVLVERSILSVGGDKLFRPNEPITKTEAAKILLYALGYGSAVELRGGWTVGVDSMASDIKLYQNLTSGGNITYADMLVMFYHALTAEIPEMVGTEDGMPVYQGKGGTYLSVYRNIYLGRGVVSSVDGVSIGGDRTEFGKIRIGDTDLAPGNVKAEEFLGRDVEFLYSDDDGEKTLVWIKARGNDDVLVLNRLDDRLEFSGSGESLTYYTQSGRKKTVSLSENLNLIYNGAYVAAGVKEILTSDFYDVRLIKSAGKNAYDTVIIRAYENYRVAALPDETTVYLECCDTRMPNRRISPDDYKKTEIVTVDGSPVKLSEISAQSIVSVFESGDKRILKMVVCSDSVKGEIQSIRTADGCRVIRVNDVDYSLYKEDAEFDREPGDEVTLLLDMSGKIAMTDRGTVKNRFGYLLAAQYTPGSVNEELSVRMYTKESGVSEFPVSDKVRIDGVRYKDKKAAYRALGDNHLSPQIVAYALKSDGEVAMIDLPAEPGDTAKKTSDNMLVKIEDGSKLYDNLSMRLGHKTVMHANSVIFGVPGNAETAEDKEYGTASVSDLEFEQSYEYTSYSYTLEDEFFYADVLAIKRNFAAGYWVSTRFAVDEITVGLNEDGDRIYFAEGYHGSEKKTIKLRATSNPDPAGLHAGDVIAVGSRIGDEIISYTVSYCPHTDPHTHAASNTGYSTGGAIQFTGYLYDIKDRVVKISYEDPATWDQMVSLQSSKILLFDRSVAKGGFREVSPQELITYKTAGAACDKVYVYINSSQMRNFIVFR